MLEVRIPISVRPAWLNRTRMIAASIRQFYPDAIVRVYIGEPGGPTQAKVQQATAALAGFGIEWIGAAEFDAWAGTRSEYIATMNRRFKTPVDGDHVLILDADVLCVRRFDELFDVDAVQGVQAHVDPIGTVNWNLLFELFGCQGGPQFPFTGNGIMGPDDATGPWYVNSGMVFAPKHLFERLCEPYQDAIGCLRRNLPDTYWFDQLALAMAVAKSGVPARTLAPRFNFPNQAGFDRAYPADLADIRFLHYLRTDIVRRDRDFETVPQIWKLVDRMDLTGSNEVLRKRVRDLVGTLLPSPLTCAEDAPYA